MLAQLKAAATDSNSGAATAMTTAIQPPNTNLNSITNSDNSKLVANNFTSVSSKDIF